MESSPHDYSAATECLAAQLVGDHVSGPVRIRCRSAMEGARTTQAAAHPRALCQEVATVNEAVAKVRHAAQGIEQTAGGLKDEPEVGDVRDHKGGGLSALSVIFGLRSLRRAFIGGPFGHIGSSDLIISMFLNVTSTKNPAAVSSYESPCRIPWQP